MSWIGTAFWALLAAAAMTGIMEGARGLGLSRMSLPFLLGTWLTGRRSAAVALGSVLSLAIGWLIALVYLAVLTPLGDRALWLGPLLGLVHGLVLLLVFLPALPYCHPRIATEFDRPAGRPRIEPPGFFGLNYGLNTPLVVLVAQTAFGAVIGASRALAGAAAGT